jgi:hypothetical protein
MINFLYKTVKFCSNHDKNVILFIKELILYSNATVRYESGEQYWKVKMKMKKKL